MSNVSKNLWVLPAVVMLCASVVPANESVTITRNLTSMPLAFTENQGQWDEQVLYRANAGGATMWFTSDGAVYQFTRRVPSNSVIASESATADERGNLMQQSGRQTPPSAPDRFDHEPDSIESIAIKATFIGANPNPRMVGSDMLEYKCNYFLGNDPDKWHTDVPNYNAIVYEDIYSGIDLKYYGNGKQMEYDFIVSPGADFSQIQIQYEGAESISTNDNGELVVTTKWGEVVEQRPVIYQIDNSSRIAVAGEYRLKGEKTFGFQLSSSYDPALPLVIDPILVYSTYLGGWSLEEGWGIAVDGAGSAYVTGWTWSSDFPTATPFDGSLNGNGDAFVTKLNSAGNSLVYSSYLGGNSWDYGYDIVVDGAGSAYVTGQTSSSDFPTATPFDGSLNGVRDAIVTKLSPAGNSLVYSSYLGGSSSEKGYGIAVDGAGSAYVTGRTYSADFPTATPFDGNLNGDEDAFVTKLNSAGNSLVYSSYLGGNSWDNGYDIVVDGAGSAYVTGLTSSADFPTVTPFDGSHNGYDDAFVTKLSTAGNNLVYSSYLGGNENDFGYDIAVDGAGSAYVTGLTSSADFPTATPFDVSWNGYWDAFVTKLSPVGNSLVYSSYLGGNSDDYGYGIAVDGEGSAYVTGLTQSADFPTATPFDGSWNGYWDAFVTILSTAGNNLVYSSYLGGDENDFGYGIAVDGAGSAYVTGRTSSADFPTATPFDGSWNGYNDAFVTKLSGEGGNQPPTASIDNISPSPAEQGQIVLFEGSSSDADGTVVDWWWESSIDNRFGYAEDFSYSGLSVGTHTITYTVKDDLGAWSAPATAQLEITEDLSWEFIHITDIHVGDDGADDRFAQMVDAINALDPAPVFVVMTGDLVAKGSGDIGVDNFQRFINIANALEMPYHTCPGNHETYSQTSWPAFWSTENYENEVNSLLNWQLSTYGINLISLYSGHDESIYDCPDQPRDGTGEGSGLTGILPNQVYMLRSWLTDNPNLPAVMFMHHPVVMNVDKETCNDEAQDEGSNGCIRYNRHDVFYILRDPNNDLFRDDAAKLVLVGHFHRYPRVFNSSDVHHPDWLDEFGYPIDDCIETRHHSDDLPLHVVTESVTRHKAYRRIGVDGDNIKVYELTRITTTTSINSQTSTSVKKSPADDSTLYPAARLHAYDSYGNHVGPNDTGGIDLEITGALYHQDAYFDTLSGLTVIDGELISLDVSEDECRYEFETVAECTLSVEGELSRQDGTGRRLYYGGIAVLVGSKVTAFVTGDSIDPHLYVDYDGDGTPELQVPPDSVVSYGFVCGDIDGSGNPTVDIADLVYLVDYMFNSGPEPPVMEAADVDGSGGGIDIADLVYLVDYMFTGGPPPACP